MIGRAALVTVIDSLAYADRQILDLHYRYDLTPAEISAVLGRSTTDIENRLAALPPNGLSDV